MPKNATPINLNFAIIPGLFVYMPLLEITLHGY